MAKRARTPARPRDLNQLASHIGALATGQAQDVAEPANEAARKRGVARAAKLSAEERREIASKAARARWEKDRNDRQGPLRGPVVS